MRLAVVGASTSATCGVRDCAATLAPALAEAGATVETVWWDRDRGGSLEEFTRHARAAVARADAVVWHYSVFAYATRGVPLAAPRVARALASPRRPLIPFLHELVHPWGHGGTRGAVYAATQRPALVPVVGAAAGVVITTDDRARWLASRRWLPHRPLLVSAVPSNIPVDAAPTGNGSARGSVAVVGYATGTPGVGVVAEALGALARRGVIGTVTLVGAPGTDPRWSTAAERSGLAARFTGVIEPREFSRELAAADAVVFPDLMGPTGRRGTLAAALAHGRAVIAFDGPQAWRACTDAAAVVLAEPQPEAVAQAVERLVRDSEFRRAQETRALDFYAREMSPATVAARLLTFVLELP